MPTMVYIRLHGDIIEVLKIMSDPYESEVGIRFQLIENTTRNNGRIIQNNMPYKDRTWNDQRKSNRQTEQSS